MIDYYKKMFEYNVYNIAYVFTGYVLNVNYAANMKHLLQESYWSSFPTLFIN